jgi:hypothetical protein
MLPGRSVETGGDEWFDEWRMVQRINVPVTICRQQLALI